MTIEREIVYDKEFVNKLNELGVTVKFSTRQKIAPGYRRKYEWMTYDIVNQTEKVLITIEDTPYGADFTFSDESKFLNYYGFDSIIKILTIAKEKVDELNKIHKEIKRQKAEEVEE